MLMLVKTSHPWEWDGARALRCYTHARTLKTINFREDKGEGGRKEPGDRKGKVSPSWHLHSSPGCYLRASPPTRGACQEPGGSYSIAPLPFPRPGADMLHLGSDRSGLLRLGLGSKRDISTSV